MSPALRDVVRVSRGFPRVSGDEPHGGSIKDAVRRFSPRERG